MAPLAGERPVCPASGKTSMTDGGVILEFAFFAFICLICVVIGAFFILYGRIWLRAYLAILHVPILEIIRLRLRRVPPVLIIEAYISLNKEGVPISTGDLQEIYLQQPVRIRRSSELVLLVTKDLKRLSPEV
ncbi:MAG: flotillin-like FloA family protein [Planctomycetota bacterium]|nr:flotillin-like FloA family protein [Planctomycetota bacterium]